MKTNVTDSTFVPCSEPKAPRTKTWGIGLALLALVGGGTVAGGAVLAQDATQTPGTALQEASPSADPSATGDATEKDERSAFIDAFAAQLGVTDRATIDAAVQAALGQLVDERVAAGDLTADEATALKAEIAAGDYRVKIGVGHSMGGRHHDHHQDRDGRFNGRDRDETADDATTPAAASTPAASSGANA